MKSMTGFSKVNFENDDFKIKIEIKSVNNKYLGLNLKYPYFFNSMENRFRTVISKYITRGSVDVRIDFRDKREKGEMLEYDPNVAKSYMFVLEQIEKDFGAEIPNKIELLVKNPNVIAKKDEVADENEYYDMLILNLEEALKKINEMRTEEGERLRAYMEERLAIIETLVQEIKGMKAFVVEDYRAKLLTKINSIESSVKVNTVEEDILKEVLIFADRSDISEEISRLESHFVQFKKEIANTNNGKKLDFIIQEMFRETNTTGVKANSYEISRRVVEIKNELEKLREQVQNIE